jgi:hypothetical protein
MRFFRKQIKIHESCKTLTLADFMPCLCNSEYDSLTISGTPTIDQLREAWNVIYLEWLELSKGNEAIKEYHDFLKAYAEQNARYIALMAAIKALSNGYSEQAEAALNRLGYHFSFKDKELKAYLEEMDKLVKRLKGCNLELSRTKDELNTFLKKIEAKKMSEIDFMEYVAMVQKFSGYFDLKITVFEFAAKASLMEKVMTNGRRKD